MWHWINTVIYSKHAKILNSFVRWGTQTHNYSATITLVSCGKHRRYTNVLCHYRKRKWECAVEETSNLVNRSILMGEIGFKGWTTCWEIAAFSQNTWNKNRFCPECNIISYVFECKNLILKQAWIIEMVILEVAENVSHWITCQMI